MESLDQAGILNHTRPVDHRFLFVGKHDLIPLDLNLSDLSLFGHGHKGAVVHILYGFSGKIRDDKAVENQDRQEHCRIKIDQRLFRAFHFLHTGFLLKVY